ncbi:ASKHA domain-containing protein [Vreelandella azerica]|uniref:ASKHA domain-containing protein n=1 Tax=Vreelandella azerica TaxID=2732867 RepID=UPI001C0F9206|nr:ASKHA domain-containing protein [Halomonas azerica]
MIPDCELEHVTSAGNAAGTGARIALLSRKARRDIEEVVRQVEKIETATEPRFQEHFVGAMAIPHKTDPFPLLRQHVMLPAPVNAQGSGESRGSRRRRRQQQVH